jgi:hypothetical protein
VPADRNRRRPAHAEEPDDPPDRCLARLRSPPRSRDPREAARGRRGLPLARGAYAAARPSDHAPVSARCDGGARQPAFRYEREIRGDRDALLEFVTEIDGISINGVDLIRWDDAGRIVDFKVMVRPLKAIQVLHQKMGELLAKLK